MLLKNQCFDTQFVMGLKYNRTPNESLSDKGPEFYDQVSVNTTLL